MMPQFAALARSLASQLDHGAVAQAAASMAQPVPQPQVHHSTKPREEPAAFDPAQLALRLKAAQDAEKRREAGLLDEEEAAAEAKDGKGRSRSPGKDQDDRVSFDVEAAAEAKDGK